MNSPSRILSVLLVCACCMAALTPPGAAQTTEPLKFSNNFFVTGDYVVGGWKKTASDGTFSTGTITIPDVQAYASNAPLQQVPAGGDVVAGILYWSSVELSGSNAGQKGFFGTSFGMSPMTGEPLGNPNAPVSYTPGGCVGPNNGAMTMQVYRANVSAYLPVDASGNLQPNTTYQVRLADGKNSNVTALGATLVLIYRVLSPDVPLKAVVIYDGAYAPSNSALIVTQKLQGMFQPGDQVNSVSKVSAIVANGQPNKNQQMYLNNYNSAGQLVHSTLLPSLYGTNPPFPGKYNGSWDNPTWFPNSYATTPAGNTAIQSADTSETAVIVPSSNNKGCVSLGAFILSTTVLNSNNDGILDVWKANQGYCDPRANLGLSTQGTCTGANDPNWVDLTGASPNQKDVFVQLDYMCSANADGTANCDPNSGGFSYAPDQTAVDNVVSAFSANGQVPVSVHIDPVHHAIPVETCPDAPLASPPAYCPFPGQSGVIGWNVGFGTLKSQPLNLNPDGTPWTEAQCVANPSTCIRRFQPGRNNSYHEVIFAKASATPNWTLADGSLVSVSVSGSNVTFTTSSAHGLVQAASVSDTTPNARVTINDAISNPNLNGTYLVKSVSGTTFTIQNANATTPAPTRNTDPFLSVTSGVVGTGSGVSDVGGANSAVSVASWGADGLQVSAVSGTLMHELGHSLGLTHGGLYKVPLNGGYMSGSYANGGGYAFTFESNCKPHFQSVMNYFFQVDLVDGHLDYSEQDLTALNESLVSPAGILSSSLFPTTKWYSPTPPSVGSAATTHCDGTPLSASDPNPTMYRLEGLASTIAWAANQDINFDGAIETNLRGYSDWPNIDLRQVGATGNDFWSGGSSRTGGGSSRTGGGSSRTGGGSSRTGGGSSRAGGGSSRTGGGVGEIDFRAANSVVRKPLGLTATLTSQNSVLLQWTPPTFAQGLISGFNVYRSKNGGPFAQLPPTPTKPIPAGTPRPLPTILSFTDTTASCTSGNYTYFVTTLITDTSASGTNGATRESLASNLAVCGR
jgi:hypothetical protein